MSASIANAALRILIPPLKVIPAPLSILVSTHPYRFNSLGGVTISAATKSPPILASCLEPIAHQSGSFGAA